MHPGNHKPFTGFKRESRASENIQLWEYLPCEVTWRPGFPPTARATQGLGKEHGDSMGSSHSSTKAHLLPPTVANVWGRAEQACTRNTPIAQQPVAQHSKFPTQWLCLCKLQVFHLNYLKSCLDFWGLLCVVVWALSKACRREPHLLIMGKSNGFLSVDNEVGHRESWSFTSTSF